MADDADRADDRIEGERQAGVARVLAAREESMRMTPGALDGVCIECDGPIEPERIAALRRTCRCSACAHDYELRTRSRVIP